MNTTLLVYLEGIWKRLDIYEDIPISVVIQQLDLNILDQRKTPFSRQFVIPNTHNNANILEHYFEVNGIEFNPLQKVECVVQYRGQDIFNGFLRLSAVIENPTYVDYEVYILGQVGDFASEIRNLTLQDINWTDLQHELNYDNITLSWECKNNNTDGLFGGKVLYPMINYGLPYDNNNNPGFTYNFGEARSFDQPGFPVPEFVWKPALRVREVLDRVFNLTQYTLKSDFFDTDYFKSMYMDTFTNGNLGIEVASAVTNQNIFKCYTRPQNVLSKNANQQADFPVTTLSPDGYDPLNNLTLAPVATVLPQNNPNAGYFRAPYPGLYGFNVRFNYDDNDEGGGQVKFQVIVRKSSTLEGLNNGTIVAASNTYQLLTSGLDGSVDFYPKVQCNAGDYVKVFILVTENRLNFFTTGGKEFRILPYDNFGVKTVAPMWELYSGPTLAGTQIVDFKLGLQQINCVDFIKSLITLFNLVVIQDEGDKSIRMEPFNWYFNESQRNEKDWTNKLDLNSSYRTEPLSFELAKEINFTYTQGSEEYLNKLFEDKNKYHYGRFKYVSTNNIFTNEQTYEIPFAPLPTTVVNGADNFIIPAVYREIDGITLQPYSNKPHLFFWVGNRYAYTDPKKTQPGTWYLQSGTTSIAQTTYPCVSHLSSLDIYIPELVSDLNFGSTFDFFGNYNTQIPQFTPNTLYNLFWEDYIEDTYSNETRRLTGRFFMRPTDVYETKLTDKIFVKDSFWRIEVINEADLVNEKLTEVSLIKERGGYYKVIPPAPFYGLSGNTPYPSLTITFSTISAFTDSDAYNVCVSGATLTATTVFRASATSYNNLDIVYYNPSPLVFETFPVGTFIRQSGTTDTYVVINTSGQIIPYDC
jgi:hypothetical protein